MSSMDTVLAVADKAYNNGEGRITDGNDLCGDGLAVFIRSEILSVLDGGADMSLEESIDEAARALRVARDELDDVILALETHPSRRTAA